MPDFQMQSPNPAVSSRLVGPPGSGVPMAFGKPSRWYKVGFAKYYGYDHPDCPFDKELVAAFRRDIDPYFIPLWVKNVYQSTSGGVAVFVRHVIAFGNPYPETRVHTDFRRSPPEFSAYWDKHYSRYPPRPHDIMEILEGPEIPWSPELPGAFYPISWMHYAKYKALGYLARELAQLGLDPKDEEARAAVEAKKKELIAIDRRFKQESDYRWDHDWRYMKNLHAGLNAEELRRIHASRLAGVHDGRMVQ